MKSTWPKVRLGEVLTQVWREELVDPAKEYRLLGARWYADGLFLKGTKSGLDIRALRLYRVQAGDFVYNRLFAWKGSFAVVGTEADGAYVSGEFPCFETDRGRLDATFLWWCFRRESTWTEALGLSAGATPTSRNRLKEARFLRMEIPLPALADQRRMVDRIEDLAAQVSESRTLRQQATGEVDELCRAILWSDKDAKPTPMRELVRLRAPDVAVQPEAVYQFAGVYSFGRGVFRAQAKSGMDFSYPRLTRLRVGDFVYPKLMAWEGALGVVPSECDGCVVSTEFPVFEVLEERVYPEVLDTYFRTPVVWPEIAGASTGTNVRRRRLNPEDFLNYRLPLPSRATQECLRRVKAEVAVLVGLQTETAVELDALLPAVLDRAFKGEL